MKIIKTLLVPLFVSCLVSTGVFAQVSARTAINVGTGSITCFSTPITAQNLSAAISTLEANYARNSDALTSLYLNLGADDQTSRAIAKRLNFFNRSLQGLNFLQTNGFTKANVQQFAAAVGTEACQGGYSCGAANALSSGQCNGCAYDEITPRTNPRTCNYSCLMCCTHFAAGASCTNSCTASDPC